ncbi:MAG: polysaccharide deacetylase family protein [Acidibacillus sp.]|nr:polysaccharide deacetylase family protein [Acidibacillus sp.]
MSFQWPEGYRAGAFITFDVDGVVGFEGSAIGSLQNRPCVRSMTDYEPRVGVPRILSVLDDAAVPATFFIPGKLAELHPDMVKNILRAGHEVGHHGHFHYKPDRISFEDEVKEIDLALPILEDLIGDKVFGSRTPGWAPSANTLKLLSERGMLYDSSLMGHDEPYRTTEGLLELPCLWSLDDWEQWGYLPFEGWEYPIEEPDKVKRMWNAHFQAIVEAGGSFVLTLHPWISGRPVYAKVLKDLLMEWKNTPGVWWTNAKELTLYANSLEL